MTDLLTNPPEFEYVCGDTSVERVDGATLRLEQVVETSENVGTLFERLCDFQAEYEGASKSSDNKHLRSSYADLAEVLLSSRELRGKHRLALTQLVHPIGVDRMTIGDQEMMVMNGNVTTILSAAGTEEWVRSSGVVGAARGKGVTLIQSFGSAVKYVRRYQLTAILGIPEVDDDGEAAGEAGADPGTSLADLGK